MEKYWKRGNKYMEKSMEKILENGENTGKVDEKILEKCEKYWKSQGNLSVQKSRNHVFVNLV